MCRQKRISVFLFKKYSISLCKIVHWHKIIEYYNNTSFKYKISYRYNFFWKYAFWVYFYSPFVSPLFRHCHFMQISLILKLGQQQFSVDQANHSCVTFNRKEMAVSFCFVRDAARSSYVMGLLYDTYYNREISASRTANETRTKM